MDFLREIPPINYIILVILGCWGGFVNFTRRKELDSNRSKFFDWLGDAIVSSGVTIITYFLMISTEGMSEIFAVAVAGVMGSKAVRLFHLTDLLIEEKFKKLHGD